MFITSLFTIAQTWKHPKCPLIDEQIKKICMFPPTTTHNTHTHTHTQEYYLAIKSEIMPLAATQMDLEIITPSEVSQTNIM